MLLFTQLFSNEILNNKYLFKKLRSRAYLFINLIVLRLEEFSPPKMHGNLCDLNINIFPPFKRGTSMSSCHIKFFVELLKRYFLREIDFMLNRRILLSTLTLIPIFQATIATAT